MDVAGTIFIFILGVIAQELFGDYVHSVIRKLRSYHSRKRLVRANRKFHLPGECLRVGDETLFIYQYAHSGIAHDQITALMEANLPSLEERYRNSKWADSLPPYAEFAQAREKWANDLNASDHLWDGLLLRPTRCDIGRTAIDEDPRVTLRFAEIRYSEARAIEDLWVGGGYADKVTHDGGYLRNIDPLFGHSFGVNCTVESADGYVILTRRSKLAIGWESRKHVSFNEGAAKIDRIPNGFVDLIGVFERGLREEIGIDSSDIEDLRSRLTIHTLVLAVDSYQWGMFGHLDLRDTNMTSADLQARRGMGIAADDWEAEEFSLLPFSESADAVIKELANASSWVPHGLLNLALSAIHRHPRQLVDIQRSILEASTSSVA